MNVYIFESFTMNKQALSPAQSERTIPILEYYNAKDICQILSISTCTIWHYVRNAKIPAPIKIGQKRLWKKSDFDNFLANINA